MDRRVGITEGKFFPCICRWMLPVSMQVLIKRIQKRGASSFCVEMRRGSLGEGGVNLILPGPRALRRMNLVSTFHHWSAELHSCSSRWWTPLGQSEEDVWEPLNTSPPFHFPSFINSGCHWSGKWPTLFIHLSPQPRASLSEQKTIFWDLLRSCC